MSKVCYMLASARLAYAREGESTVSRTNVRFQKYTTDAVRFGIILHVHLADTARNAMMNNLEFALLDMFLSVNLLCACELTLIMHSAAETCSALIPSEIGRM